MINIMKCNNIDLNTLIEINQSEINKMQSCKNPLPFMTGDINRLQKDNKELTFLINHTNK
tara:strand:- start:103 stop:282 length:180 start_codon:yes stop_codon:yes gene_type:complete